MKVILNTKISSSKKIITNETELFKDINKDCLIKVENSPGENRRHDTHDNSF